MSRCGSDPDSNAVYREKKKESILACQPVQALLLSTNRRPVRITGQPSIQTNISSLSGSYPTMGSGMKHISGAVRSMARNNEDAGQTLVG